MLSKVVWRGLSVSLLIFIAILVAASLYVKPALELINIFIAGVK